MFRAKSFLEAKLGDRSYHLYCDHDSPLVELIQVLDIIKNQVQETLEKIENQKTESIEVDCAS